MPRAPKKPSPAEQQAAKLETKLAKQQAAASYKHVLNVLHESPYPGREHRPPPLIDNVRTLVDYSGELARRKHRKQRKRQVAATYSAKDMKRLENHIGALERKIAKQREKITSLKRGTKRARKPKAPADAAAAAAADAVPPPAAAAADEPSSEDKAAAPAAPKSKPKPKLASKPKAARVAKPKAAPAPAPAEPAVVASSPAKKVPRARALPF